MSTQVTGKEFKPSANKTFAKYSKLLDAHVMTESEIASFRKIVGGCSTLPVQLRQALLSDFLYNVEHNRHYKITKDQTTRGIAWLKNYAFKLNGEVRKSCKLGTAELEVIKNFKCFEFIGLQSTQCGRNFWDANQWYAPIYRVIAKSGHYFDYVAGTFGTIKVTNVGEL